MSSSRTSRRSLLVQADLESWPSVEPFAFSPEDRETFVRRRNAVVLYRDGAPLKEIERLTGICRQVLYGLIDRCFAQATDGRLMGFRALVRYRHVASERTVKLEKLSAPYPVSGAFQALLARHPSLYELLRNLAITGRKDGAKNGERRIKFAVIHELFKNACIAEGIRAPGYPFNGKSEARQAVKRIVQRLRTEFHREFLAHDDPEVLERIDYSNWDSTNPSRYCYQRVECDGHKLDIECTIEVPGLNGEGVVSIRISRLWLLALIEVMSGAVIGYSIAYGQNYSASDVIRAVRSALESWSPRKLQSQMLCYREGEGIPNGLYPELAYVRWDEFWLDNHAAHLSDYCLTAMERLIGGVCVFGPVGHPNARPHIEDLFLVLEEAGIHRAHGTTGSNPQDKRRKQESKDLRYHLSEEMLLDMVDLLIARYNGARSPSSTCSRTDVLFRAATLRTTMLRRIPLTKRSEIFRFDIIERGTVGSDHGGSVVRFKGGRYWNDRLRLEQYVGQEIVIMADSSDLRVITVILHDGTDLGSITVEPRWRNTRHSLQTRQEIVRAQSRDSTLRRAADLPAEFRRMTEELARTSRTEAARLARLRKEQALADSDAALVAEADSSDLRGNDVDEAAMARTRELLQKVGVQYR